MELKHFTTGINSFTVDSFKATRQSDEALRHLALCHSVLIDPSKPDKYNASSPDEQALVEGARDCGFKFIGRTSGNKSTINI